jgi:histidinol phosphatase-like PHP family hydrolase
VIGTDYHIHTAYVHCANDAMTIPAILDHCRRAGRVSVAITDHCDLPKQLDQNRAIRAELERTDCGGLEVFFGGEFNVQNRDGELFLGPAQMRAERMEIIVAGVHGTWFEPGEAPSILAVFERQTELMCKVASRPEVDVLVHPWWWPGSQLHEPKHRLHEHTSMDQVPVELTRRLAATCVEHGTAVECNVSAIFTNRATSDTFKESYRRYLARLVELGCSISLCTDAHSLGGLDNVVIGERLLAEIGLPESQVWRPSVAARVAGSGL